MISAAGAPRSSSSLTCLHLFRNRREVIDAQGIAPLRRQRCIWRTHPLHLPNKEHLGIRQVRIPPQAAPVSVIIALTPVLAVVRILILILAKRLLVGRGLLLQHSLRGNRRIIALRLVAPI